MTSGGKTVVFFDLETTGLERTCDIIQLAAISGGRSFNVYTMPRVAISSEAASITGFSVQGGALLLHGRAVPTVTLYQALSSFLAFLRSFRQPVLLAAHNAKRFDAPILTRVLVECSLTREFEQLRSSYLDTYLLSKVLHPNIGRYSQAYLVQYFLGKDYNAHNALSDATALEELYSCWNPNKWHMIQCVF